MGLQNGLWMPVVFSAGYVGKNSKRLITSVDGGSVVLTNRQGYSIYRNVNKEATEAIPDNKGKLVYSYNMGTSDLEEVQPIRAVSMRKPPSTWAHVSYLWIPTTQETTSTSVRKLL